MLSSESVRTTILAKQMERLMLLWPARCEYFNAVKPASDARVINFPWAVETCTDVQTAINLQLVSLLTIY